MLAGCAAGGSEASRRIDVHHHLFSPAYVDELAKVGQAPPIVRNWSVTRTLDDKAIDRDYEKAVLLMEGSRFGEALAAFSTIIKKRPEFAEAWNKRATIYYMVGEFDLSLKDCDEVMKRNPHHFGALSGYGQIYLQMGELDRALAYFQRALKVNPDMPGAVQAVQMLEQQLRSKGRQST